jgi:hypothetical protein
MIGILRFDSRRGPGISIFTTAMSRTALGPTQPPIQWVPGALTLGVKWSWREADHSPPSSAEVKGWMELYHHSPNTPSWRGAPLKNRDNFTFTFTLWICWTVYDSLVGGIGPTQGLYLHTGQHNVEKTGTHPCLEWNSNPRSQCSSGRRQYVPQTARPLEPATSIGTLIKPRKLR